MTLYVHDPKMHLYAGYRPLRPDDITEGMIDDVERVLHQHPCLPAGYNVLARRLLEAVAKGRE